MFLASSLAWRTACCALGTQKPPGPGVAEMSGTCEVSPAVHAPSSSEPSSDVMRRLGLAITWPRGPIGRSVPRRNGRGMTPAVQTMRSDS